MTKIIEGYCPIITPSTQTIRLKDEILDGYEKMAVLEIIKNNLKSGVREKESNILRQKY